MSRPLFLRLSTCLFLLASLLWSVPKVRALDGRLLPLDQAFQLTTDASTPGRLQLDWSIAPDYYLYRGRIKVSAGPDVTLKTLQLPPGTKHVDAYFGTTHIYHHSLHALIIYTMTKAGAGAYLNVQYQGCHEVTPKLCYPPHAEKIYLTPSATGTTAGVATVSHHDPLDIAFKSLGNEPVRPGQHIRSIPPSQAKASIPKPVRRTSLLAVLVLALMGGLLLNLMPCVLPVLSIKAVSLLESGESPTHRRRHALTYSAGVLCSFALLGLLITSLRASGHVLGWGVQLQHPLLVAILACLMFALGLSMSGVVHYGASLGQVGSTLATRRGSLGDFVSGVLAVVVASPCTAPFMGSALAYAFTAPALTALPIFLTLGLGLSLPFLLIGFVPALARVLPRPGRWMETLKQLLAFPMYLASIWLTWVLGHQRGTDAMGLLLLAIVLLALALWWFERSRQYGRLSRALVICPALLMIASLYGISQIPATATPIESNSASYDPVRLATLRRAGTPVLVAITADWCITCKVNEHAVLNTAAFHTLLKRTGTVYMEGDWTNENPVITAFMNRYHAPGVPLYVIFPRHHAGAYQLPTVLSLSLLQKSLTQDTVP